MILKSDQHGHVKVKVNELKTHLSRYLRELEAGGPIEVCVRDAPVAYLVSARKQASGTAKDWAGQIQSTGLVYHPKIDSAQTAHAARVAPPVRAGDGRTDIDSVQHMREGRDC